MLEEAGFDLLLHMMSRQWAARISALVGFAAVALGAFGAHGLRAALEQHGSRQIWETAVLYHLAHSVVLLFLAGRSGLWRSGPWLCFFFGIVIFSGSLYLLAVSGWRWWGAVTPLGGVAFLAGWLWLAIRPGIEPER